MSAAKYGVEQDFSEAGIVILPVYANKASLDAAGYSTGGSMAYAGGAFYGRNGSAFREFFYRDGAGGADYIPVSDVSGVYQAVAKSSFLSGYVTNPLGSALAAGGFKITGLADGTASGDALHYGQLGSTAVKAAVNYWTESGGNVYRESGNVSIGTVNSYGGLTILKPSITIPALLFGNNSYGWNFYERSDNGDLEIRRNHGGEAVQMYFVRATGRTGWGIVPTTHFQVNKSSQTIAQSVPAGALVLSNLSAGNGVIELGTDANANSWVQSRNIESATSYPLLLNPSGGNVGVGTTTTPSLLTVAQNSYAVPVALFENTGTNGATMEIKHAATTDGRYTLKLVSPIATTYFDTRGYIGVGVSPTYPITVKGPVASASYENTSAHGEVDFDFRNPSQWWRIGLNTEGGISDSMHIRNVTTGDYPITIRTNNPRVGLYTLDPTAMIDVNGTARIRSLTAIGTVTTDASGNISRANHFDYSGVLTANRSMILDSYSFTIDGSGASTSPGTMLILKGKESSFTTRFLDYQNESGTTSFRASSTASLVTLEAMNAHGLKLASPSGQEVSINSGGSQTTRWLTDGTLRRPQLVGNPASILQGSEWFDISAIRPAWSVGTTAGDVRHAASMERDLIGNTVATITTSSNTIGGANHNYRFDANAGSIANTLGADLDEGVEYLFRCTANGTNTITFDADTGNSYIFYIDTVSSTTSTTFVAGGAGGTGITAPYKIYFVRRIGTVIFIS